MINRKYSPLGQSELMKRKIDPFSTLDYVKVKLSKSTVELVTYKSLMQAEMIYSNGKDLIDPFRFQSMLFINLGYNKCQSNDSWMKAKPFPNNSSLTKISELKDWHRIKEIPHTFYPLVLVPNKSSLYEFLNCINFWTNNRQKRGYFLDTKRSFKLPSDDDIKYRLQNGIFIDQTMIIDSEAKIWNSSNIFRTRLFNLNPLINESYFSMCIKDFITYSKQVKIKYPYSAFTMALINPDFIQAMIRLSEMEACKKFEEEARKDIDNSNIISIKEKEAMNELGRINRQKSYMYTLREDTDIVKYFEEILNERFSHIEHIYRNYGFVGLEMMNYEYTKRNPNYFGKDKEIDFEEKSIEKYSTQNSDQEMFDDIKLSIESLQREDIAFSDKLFLIDNIPLDSILDKLFKYIDDEKLPLSLKQNIRFDPNSNNKDSRSALFYKTFQRVMVVLANLSKYFPEFLNKSDKMILSNNLFLDENRFAIYRPGQNAYIVFTLDGNTQTIKTLILSPKEVLSYYEKKYNYIVYLDPNEVDIISEESPNFDIAYFDKWFSNNMKMA